MSPAPPRSPTGPSRSDAANLLPPDARHWAEPTQWSEPPHATPTAPPTLPLEESELHVSCAPSAALQQQFEQRPMAYVALHDIGPAGSRRLLTGVAAATHRPLQRLMIRRRSFGDLLATVWSLEIAGPDGEPMRVYTTDVEAADADRQGLMHTLLAFARLSVVMVGGDALHHPRAGLADLDRALARPPWPNRHLLLLPMGPAVGLATVGQDLAIRYGLQVLTTPVVNRPSEAWQFIQSSHARLQTHGVLSPPRRGLALDDGGLPGTPGQTRPPAFAGSGGSGGSGGLRSSAGPLGPSSADRTTGADSVSTQPAGLTGRRTGPSTRGGLGAGVGGSSRRSGLSGPASLGAGGSDPWNEIPIARLQDAADGRTGAPHSQGLASGAWADDRRAEPIPWSEPLPVEPHPADAAGLQPLLDRVSRMGGFVGACVFHLSSGRSLAHRGDGPEAQALGRRGAALVNASTEAARSLHLDDGFSEVWITLATHHLIVRPVLGHRHLGLHVVLDRQVANPMLARVQLQRLDEDPAIATGGGL